MRLFLALWPDAEANAEVDRCLAAHVDGARWRVVDPARRHLTVRFLGDDADADRARATLQRLPRERLGLRCRGAGLFGDALWLGVDADDPDRLGALVAVAGDDPDRHVAHLTVARRRRGAAREPIPPGLAAWVGRWWWPGEVDLVASGRPYRVLDRVELG